MGKTKLCDKPHHFLHVEGTFATIDRKHAEPAFTAQTGRKDSKPSSLICLACIAARSLEQALQTPPQAVHLVDQMQDDGDAFIIDAEILTQIANELCARQIDVGEHQL